MTEEEQVEVTEYEKCRVCGSEDTLIARLQKKVEEKGLKLDGYPECLGAINAIMQRQNSVSIVGMVAPAGMVNYDVCMECGTLRALRVSITKAIRGATG